MSIVEIWHIILIILFVGFVILPFFNKYLPVWFCYHMDWHLAPKKQDFDGCSLNGRCPRCGFKVLQDSQGNWFKSSYQED